MATKTINWDKGGGSFTVTYGGSGNGTIVVTSDANTLHEARSQSLTVKTTKGGTVEKTITVAQAMKPYIDLTNAVVTAANQTYSGSAKTPTPTVKLNGTTIPSTGYDVTYSDNTNAGTATITITGKGDYTGTATGTFTIAKANPTYTAPVAMTNLTYNGSSKYLTTAGSTSHGTIYYSLDGTNWYTTRRTRTNAGTYTSYWKLTGDANHNDVASTSITTTIAKASGSVTTAPTAKSVTYNGSSQALINAGSGTGTMYYRYKLSTSSTWSSWSTSVPSRTDAGTYNIEYYAAASTNYEQSSTGSLNVTMAKASRTLSFSNPTTVVAPSGNVTNTATPSAGASDGTITYSISSTTYATINSSSGKVTAKTSEGSATVTATISEGTNYLSASASYVIRVFSTVHAFAYTGNVQSLNLPAGTYKLQVWGAQGGSNAAASSYGITAQAGGKGGYSEGILTIGEDKTVYVFVGGQGGSSDNGGWNGGGGGSGSSSYNSGNTHGVSRMGCGGGGTDIALVTSTMTYSSYRTNRSSESLLSRMIVAGGGSGGAMCYRGITSTVTDYSQSGSVLTCKSTDSVSGNKVTLTGEASVASSVLTLAPTHTEVEETTLAQVGYVGGGTNGGGYSSTYQGKQTSAGTNGGFGYGANQTTTNYRYCSACGGGGWYGGGGASYSDSTMNYCKYSGGGSGFVNTSASAGNRPSGYTGLQLDSGTTYDGSQSFPNTAGTGNETGHEGDGYAKITRL